VWLWVDVHVFHLFLTRDLLICPYVVSGILCTFMHSEHSPPSA
jgi:hypothetical protein